MKETAVNKLPYPEDTDPPDGPGQIKALADVLDTLKYGSRNLKPSIGLVTGEAAEAFGTANTFVDVPGAKLEITPAVAGNLIVVTNLAVEATTTTITGGETFEMQTSLKVDAEAELARVGLYKFTGLTAPPLPFTISVMQFYVVPLTAAKHTIQLRARRSAFGRRLNLPGNASGFAHALFAS